MINGIHAIFYSKRVARMHAFLSDVLELPWVDAGGGRRFYAAPPTELGVHATGDEASHELYLMCDDVEAVTAKLAKRGIKTTMPITDRGWGLVTELRLPGGDTIGLYEPKHLSPIRRKQSPAKKAKKAKSSTSRASR